MATKEKDDGKLTKTMTPVEKELNGEAIKTQLQESVDYHNKLVQEKDRMLGELNKVENALSQNIGKINTLQGLQKDFFVADELSGNGSA
jgi:hypothetical protein